MRPATLVLPTLLFLGAGALLAPTPALAHHAFATEFDVNRPVSLEGVVTKVQLMNPHSWITIEVTDENGETVEWMFEGGSPNALIRRGITRASLPIGSALVVGGYQARDGSNRAVGRDVTFADGRQLFFGGTPTPEPEADAAP
jgi:hypothetical protein